MIKNGEKERKGLSGKTQALLRAGIKERDKDKIIAPSLYRDAEDGARLKLNTMSFVDRSNLDEPNAVTKLVEAAAPSTSALPDLGPHTGIRGNDLGAILEAIHEHQSVIARELVQREAGREAMRQSLTAFETVPWRAEQLRETFKMERAEQFHALKVTLSNFKEGIKKYENKFAAEALRDAKAEQVKVDRRLAEEKFSKATGTGKPTD